MLTRNGLKRIMASRFRETGDGRIFVPHRGTPPPAPEGYVALPHDPYMFRPISPITNEEATERELYQHLYEDGMLNYGSAKHNRCPGVKFFEYYKHWLKGKVFDLGCGRGDTVRHIRDAGFEADGLDQVDLDNDMLVGDITKPVSLKNYDTSICIDVFEHLKDIDLDGVLENMQQTEQQVISVHTGPAFEIGCTTDLHINKKTFDSWRSFIERKLKVVEFKQLGRQRGLFFCQG
jgi:hypothetical protein